LLRKGKNGNSKYNHWSEHGLGHLLNPADLESDDREWIAQVWLAIIGNCRGIPAPTIDFVTVPAIRRLTITSRKILDPLATLNMGKKYQDQINRSISY
jgi:hypothetical protein